MLALVGALFFALALVVDWIGTKSDFFNYPTLDTIGLLLVALHVAGVGSGFDWRAKGRTYRRGRRR